ncbi:ankyrin repeat-containing protein ITN1-like isoform X2 [Vitis riparia]|uniref:ankyrin repeat-containing protein ITN1-like isoform X2 n=1 Tax=Vitis riparia TaxID=96939 RepID=UPI00155A4250|nr:ankyrin repeat-containing protein ITN1-like isoform X2 [Vitis riparia]
MANTNLTDQERRIRIDELYKALTEKNEYVGQVLGSVPPEHPLKKISYIYDNTFLHMAIRFKEKDLVYELLKLAKEDNRTVLSNERNNEGNTVLHEVATSDTMKYVAKKMLEIDQQLLFERNNLGETPIFCAARYGQIEMFWFLAEQLKQRANPEVAESCLKRTDRTTVLHISIFNECFDWSLKETVKKRYERYFLNELVRLLVKYDTSWDASINSSIDVQNQVEKAPELSQALEHTEKKSDEDPLFLATISNIPEIVEEIIINHPQALEYTNKEGMNILHVAILYCHIDIFDMVTEKFEALSKMLLSATDNKENSLLHMVGQKRKGQVSEKIQSPTLQLRKELLLFEKVKKACQKCLIKPLNKENKTAEELFATRNEQLHKEAKEWLMRTTENCTILSVFIATVAFAAAYTVPGGPDQSTGIPILNCKPFFVVFILADVFSLTLALTSVGIFLSILTSSFPLEHFEKYLFKKLIQGIICMILSVSMMAVAFGATIILIMKHNWKEAIWHVVAFLPVPIFFLSYSPLRSAVPTFHPGN